jgi:hypothetical protein
MARPDGRIEPGQPLGSAISARAWNRAQDAADIVLGATPGVVAGPPSPPDAGGRVIVNMRKRSQSQEIYPGHAVMFAVDLLGGGGGSLITRVFPVPQWPATKDTFDDSISANTSDRVKSLMYSHLTKRLPQYYCELLTPENALAEQDFFPDVGIAVSASDGNDEFVKVCISGPCLAYVRFFFSYQTNQTNLCAIRPRNIEGISGPIGDATGCLDVHRGGNIRVLGQESLTGFPSNQFPCIVLAQVML